MSHVALARAGSGRSCCLALTGITILFLAIAVAAGNIAAAAPSADTRPNVRIPPYGDVQAAVSKHFHSIKRTANDLISQGDVEPVFDELATMGWSVADRQEIVRDILPDKSFVVRKLRQGRGRNFARNVGGLPDGYDRVDRLSRLPHGHTFLDGLIVSPDGWKMIAYMTEAPGGHVLGEQIGHAPLGRNFNDQTGRIYTSDQFLDRLRRSYERATGQTIPAPPKKKPPKRSLINVVPRD